MLASGERSVGEIANALAITGPAVSQHLKGLKEAGLVRVRIDGQRRLYRLDPERFRELQNWLSQPAAAQKASVPIATLIDATGLASWADRRDAQAFLPSVVRRLIVATAQVTQLSFRSGEGVQLSGWDGTVGADEGNAFVPMGVSVWEMGTSQNPRRKAQ